MGDEELALQDQELPFLLEQKACRRNHPGRFRHLGGPHRPNIYQSRVGTSAHRHHVQPDRWGWKGLGLRILSCEYHYYVEKQWEKLK